MDYNFRQTLFSRCLLSGLLAGFAAVILNFVYDYIYRSSTNFSLSEVVNVPSIIFTSLIVNLVFGLLYYAFNKIKNGRVIFIVAVLLITVLGVYAAFQIQRTSIPANQHEFRILFAGVMIIDGLCAAFLIPYFTSHSRVYS